MWSLSLEWMLLALAVFWAVGAYGRIARLRSSCVQQFGAVDACLGQWQVLLQAFAAQQSADSPLHQAAQQLQAALAEARDRPLREASLASLEQACSALDAAWQALLAGMRDEDRAGDAGTLPAWLQRGAEQQLRNRLGLQQFNAAAERHNAAIGQYPARLLGGLLGWQPVRSLRVEPAALAQESGT